ncbi:MFS transporter [Kibdelosporangium persicum]|uniref:Multidrug resistance protein 3 n=1 Tax=Kibdelosporangium persicum TaxID=2698649 RepID=A0ABX2F1G4_9PSEU|nr:MFS transporter [Kibdelosporangium persicum]NRN65058.1 Multidrug resistance protein 3 [Kibdelosporangium persicum]
MSRTLAVLAIGAGVFSLLQSLTAPVLPTIQQELNTSQNTVTWVLTAYLLSASVFTPVLGRVGDMVGKRRTLVAVMTALAAGLFLAAIAPNIEVLILARVVQGAGGALIPLAFGIIRDEFPRERSAAAIGTLSAIFAVGSGLGVVLAGPVVSSLGMRWLFWLPLGIVLIAAFAAHRFVPESPVRTPGRINWVATGLLSAWLVTLLLGVSQSTSLGWDSPTVLGLLGAAVVLIVAWIRVEVRSDNPLIDMRMMRLPAVWSTNTVALLFGAAMFAAWAFIPQFVQTPASQGYGFGASVSQAGLLMLPMLVTMFIAGILSGRIVAVFSFRAQLAVGSVLSAVACTVLAFAHDREWEVAAGSGLLGLGIGLAFATMTNLVVQAVPVTQTGAASGMNANIRTVGGSIGAGVMSSLVTAQLGAGGLPLESGYTTGFATFAVISVIAAGAALLVPRERRAELRPAAA